MFKNGDRTQLSNYRPIPFLPGSSKGLEKIICCRLSDFLESKTLITGNQFAFRKHFPTEAVLLQLNKFILKNLEERFLSLGAFLELSKDLIRFALLVRRSSPFIVLHVKHMYQAASD